MDKIATGIGSREAPADAVQEAEHIAYEMARIGWLWRSGAAPGMDAAFERGVDKARGTKEIFLPWKGFNGSDSGLHAVGREALALASTIHPAWERLGGGPRKLHARNCYQVLGRELDRPTSLVVCWTPDGCASRAMRSNKTGGTATAIVLASDRGIPVFNLRNMDARIRLNAFLGELGISYRLPVDQSDVAPQAALF